MNLDKEFERLGGSFSFNQFFEFGHDLHNGIARLVNE